MKSRLIGLIVLVGGVVACGKREIRTTDFTFPIPRGYVEETSAPMAPGALAIRQRQRVQPDFFMGSVVVTPIPPSNPPFNAADPTLCSQVGVAIAQQQGATLIGAGIVSTPFGGSCQYDIQSNTTRQAARGIVMRGPRSMWMLTCNHDPRDAAVLSACQSVVDGWRFL
ncbi:MAG: hypothetical protein WCJ30_00485 [Deltaproteobacteria bacterium]